MSGTNWNSLTLTLAYSSWPTQIIAQDVSAITWLDSSLTADTNVPTKAKRWNDTNKNWEVWSGSAWGALSSLYGINISGNAATASSVAWGGVSGKPTTLGGYGITDAPNLTGSGASGTWGINITGNAATATNATLAATATNFAATQQVNALLGAQKSMSMSQDSGATQGSVTHRATGTGDANLAGETFWNDAYAIKLGIRADGYFGLGGWSRAAWSWYSDPNGNMVAAGNVTAYSDPRLKENFETVVNPLGIINSLRGGTFTWKKGIAHTETKAGKRDYGILANEVEAVMPEIVTDSIALEGEVYKTVSYEKLVPVLIEAIKELEARVKFLEEK